MPKRTQITTGECPSKYLALVVGALIFLQGCDLKRPSVTVDVPTAKQDITPAAGQGGDHDPKAETWMARGEVVDKNGQVIDDFEAAAIWSSNGVYWNQSGDIPAEERVNVWKREGVIAVRPQFLAKNRANGKFSLEIQDRPRVPILAVNADRTLGGIVVVERGAADELARIELKPLVRVTGEVFCPEAGKVPEWAKAEIYVVGGGNVYLTQCGTYQGKVSFRLPPGQYEVYAVGESPVGRMRVPQKPSDVPLHGDYQRGKRFTVPSGVTDFDLGVLELRLPKDAEGNSVDITAYYGKRPPKLDIIDAINVSADRKLEDYRGKWVVIEFWARWCAPCVAVELPKLSKFYEEHSDQRDQFEILSVCDTKVEGAKSIAEFEPLLSKIRKSVWDGKKLPFPVLLDNESRTASAYGISGRPSFFLIDPEGNLVNTFQEDGLQMLEKILAEQAAREK